MMIDSATHPALRLPTAALAATLVAAALGLPSPAGAQSYPLAEDVASPEAIVTASYEALSRAPGENFDWARFRSLWLPGGLMIPNTEQTGGTFTVMTVDDFVDWVDGWYAENAPIGGPGDQGFVEAEIHAVHNRYGDVVQVMSTYQKHLYGSDEILGRGINSIQLVFDGGRWWIVSTAWDEENGAGPLPERYVP